MDLGEDYCGWKGYLHGGGEDEAQVAEGDAAKVGGDERRVRVQEIVHHVKFGVRQILVDWLDVWVFEDLDELVDGGGHYGGGELNNQQLTIIK